MAIEHAMVILAWHENLPEEEVPPEHIWHDGDGLEDWWNRVKAKREAKFGGSGSSSLDVDDDDVEQNALAAAFKK